jgi:hypothetical protein
MAPRIEILHLAAWSGVAFIPSHGKRFCITSTVVSIELVVGRSGQDGEIKASQRKGYPLLVHALDWVGESGCRVGDGAGMCGRLHGHDGGAGVWRNRGWSILDGPFAVQFLQDAL